MKYIAIALLGLLGLFTFNSEAEATHRRNVTVVEFVEVPGLQIQEFRFRNGTTRAVIVDNRHGFFRNRNDVVFVQVERNRNRNDIILIEAERNRRRSDVLLIQSNSRRRGFFGLRRGVTVRRGLFGGLRVRF